jgi:hypothetical protein
LKIPKHTVAALVFALFPLLATAGNPAGGPHDFDFEFGSWKAHLRRLVTPLSGSDEWAELDGTNVVRKVWDGRANLGELKVKNGKTRIEGLSLRLYNPETRQWSIYWANARNGELTTPMVGGFHDGRGEFYGKDTWDGKPIEARFIFSPLGPTSFRIEQAFTADERKTWETNWIATFTR